MQKAEKKRVDQSQEPAIVKTMMNANFWKNVTTVPNKNTPLNIVVSAPAVTEMPISVRLS
eukprot:CAMPEP_0198237440 /NCGR_PEP_ID=MMETSP1446-20131203/3296_1 /TAXON_ID=1461542 ORGANISM="Unidentified sp, Strain CCMP2111" /NCGR_SAMPLE_ID=MMETSP1446 /ASSEMBLY_ACC=CAM_ASM_001112 /LENGTH=59 /DNA_ID=CAMNT_0043919607 /DNA_START=329 /DNA_END=504 /DNA_ORIENTATION=+